MIKRTKRRSFTEKALGKRTDYVEIILPIAILLLFFVGAGIVWKVTAPTVPKPTKPVPIAWITIPSGPPTNLIINGQRWLLLQYDYHDDKSFDVRDAKGSLVGHVGAMTQCSTNTIWYDPFVSQTLLHDDVWHEINHAELCGEDDAKMQVIAHIKLTHDHCLVYQLGMSGSSFIHDNPEFMKWMEDWK